MYTEFYKLTGRPFQLTPDPAFYYDSRAHKKAMAYLTYGLSQGEGFVVVTGEIGAGKTTLVGHLLNELDPGQYVVARVVTSHLDADNILRMVASSFGLKVENADKATILNHIESFLIKSAKSGKCVVLIVDEAQNLPNTALEELRMLSNFQLAEKPLLQSVLLGQPQFRDRFINDPDLEQLKQRVVASHHLQPMDEGEVAAYVEHRLKLVGWRNDPVFTDGCFKKLYEYTGGIPRKLNTLCSRLLLCGYLEELHELTPATVDEVAAELIQNDSQSMMADQKISSLENGAGGNSASGADNAAMLRICERITVLEKYVKTHDHTIFRALEIVSHWLDNTDQIDADERS